MERVHCVIRQFGRQPHSTVRLLCAPATLHTRGSRATRKRENVTFMRRDGKWRCTGSSCLPAPADLSPIRLCIVSQRAGHRPCGNLGLVCLVPCWNLRPVFQQFRHHHRTLWNLSLPRLRQLSWCFASIPKLLVLASTCGHGDLGQGSHQSRQVASTQQGASSCLGASTISQVLGFEIDLLFIFRCSRCRYLVFCVIPRANSVVNTQ